jgi:hypothetical protein
MAVENVDGPVEKGDRDADNGGGEARDEGGLADARLATDRVHELVDLLARRPLALMACSLDLEVSSPAGR